MDLPNASTKVALEGYDHLSYDDRPWYGIGGLTDEQRLSHRFQLELVIRTIHKHQQGQRNPLVEQRCNTLDSLPVDR